MIDIESHVLNHVAKRIRDDFPKTFISGEYVETPASFPTVTIEEKDNRILERMRTINIENAVTVMYEVNVYSDKSSGKKQEAKEIANVTDSAFLELGFTRTFRQPTPNLLNASIYRILMRYSAVIGPYGENGFLVYQS